MLRATQDKPGKRPGAAANGGARAAERPTGAAGPGGSLQWASVHQRSLPWRTGPGAARTHPVRACWRRSQGSTATAFFPAQSRHTRPWAPRDLELHKLVEHGTNACVAAPAASARACGVCGWWVGVACTAAAPGQRPCNQTPSKNGAGELACTPARAAAAAGERKRPGRRSARHTHAARTRAPGLVCGCPGSSRTSQSLITGALDRRVADGQAGKTGVVYTRIDPRQSARHARPAHSGEWPARPPPAEGDRGTHGRPAAPTRPQRPPPGHTKTHTRCSPPPPSPRVREACTRAAARREPIGPTCAVSGRQPLPMLPATPRPSPPGGQGGPLPAQARAERCLCRRPLRPAAAGSQLKPRPSAARG